MNEYQTVVVVLIEDARLTPDAESRRNTLRVVYRHPNHNRSLPSNFLTGFTRQVKPAS
ncbi:MULTISPECIES: hypothetical protein [unclassified Rhodococcus (in: high G+C Gram-positive bacteria)]|uniref:hypothetical protein n=1 Tax=unclassified Rhodococcus (in: high G+C Gram-positive bacteria) TaxID=192944 RepID=UPI001F334CBC|nr:MULTISPECIES: hypothetical protein [unclassified Rhodococcus (in: high G+C Gram-positive bacteria)]